MRTWNATTLVSSAVYVADVNLAAWTERKRANLQAESNSPKELAYACMTVSEWQVHADSTRSFRQIIAAHRAKLDRATDRALANRTDALGALFARAPKTERKPRTVAA